MIGTSHFYIISGKSNESYIDNFSNPKIVKTLIVKFR